LPPPDPEHLFGQADALAASPQLRQADMRRAISAAHYGLFHFTLTAAADMVVGFDDRSGARYSLVYRSVDHSRLRALCSQLSGTKPQNLPLVPSGGFGTIADFARIAGHLYELRNLADYDPSRDFTHDEARLPSPTHGKRLRGFNKARKSNKRHFSLFCSSNHDRDNLLLAITNLAEGCPPLRQRFQSVGCKVVNLPINHPTTGQCVCLYLATGRHKPPAALDRYSGHNANFVRVTPRPRDIKGGALG
jgi:hypothetical protein